MSNKVVLSYSLGEGGEVEWLNGMGLTVSADGLLSVVMQDETQVAVKQFANAGAAEAALVLIEADIRAALESVPTEGGVEVIVIDDY